MENGKWKKSEKSHSEWHNVRLRGNCISSTCVKISILNCWVNLYTSKHSEHSMCVVRAFIGMAVYCVCVFLSCYLFRPFVHSHGIIISLNVSKMWLAFNAKCVVKCIQWKWGKWVSLPFVHWNRRILGKNSNNPNAFKSNLIFNLNSPFYPTISRTKFSSSQVLLSNRFVDSFKY